MRAAPVIFLHPPGFSVDNCSLYITTLVCLYFSMGQRRARERTMDCKLVSYFFYNHVVLFVDYKKLGSFKIHKVVPKKGRNSLLGKDRNHLALSQISVEKNHPETYSNNIVFGRGNLDS